MTDDPTGMQPKPAKLATALIILALALSAYTRRGESPMTGTVSEDDDTFCRADNTQRKLGEYMLNNPTKP
jgi:hypothetical protein